MSGIPPSWTRPPTDPEDDPGNPPPPGPLPGNFSLEISRVPVQLNPTGTGDQSPFSLESIKVAYNTPRVLTFSEIVGLGPPTYNLGQGARLKQEGQVRFRGTIVNRNRHYVAGRGVITYVCLGPMWRGSQRLAENQLDGPLIEFTPYHYSTPIKYTDEAVVQLFDVVMNDKLRAEFIAGADLHPDWPMHSGEPRLDIGPITFRNRKFTEAVEDLLALMPGYKLLVVPTARCWTFVDQSSLTPVTLTIGIDDLIEIDLDESVDDRHTAVQFMASIPYAPSPATAELERTWEDDDEADWSEVYNSGIDSMEIEGAGTVLADPKKDLIITMVQGHPWFKTILFKRWKIPDAVRLALRTDLPVAIWQQFKTGSGGWQYVQVDAEVNLDTGLVWTKEPALATPGVQKAFHRNRNIKGKAKPGTLFIRYYPLTSNFPLFYRVPTSGYAGSAYTEANVKHFLNLLVDDPTEITEANVQRAFAAFSDILYTGKVTIRRALVPADFWDLGICLNLNIDGGELGLDSLNAPVDGFSYQFASKQLKINLSTDRSWTLRR